MLAVLLFWAFAGCIAVQYGYAGFFFVNVFRLPLNISYKRPDKTPVTIAGATITPGTPDLPVSVIICARNEADELRRNLPAIFAQRYSNAAGDALFEVIVVNDCSTDHTAAVLEAFRKDFPGLRVVTLTPEEERSYPGKKFPLSRGIAAARHDFLLLTDADCRPASDHWIEAMMVHPWTSGPHNMIVGGYGQLAAGPGLLNAFSRWETMHTFLQYWSYAARNRPYMVVGRNLACRKEALLQAQQAPLWRALPSGDDDLLVRLTLDHYHNPYKDPRTVQILSLPWSFTVSRTMDTWGAWLRQKQRHLSTGKLYQASTQALLGGYALSHAGLWLLAAVLVFTPWRLPVLLLLGLRCALYWGIWWRAARALREPGLQYYLPLFDFGWMVYNFVLSPYIFWKNKQQWK